MVVRILCCLVPAVCAAARIHMLGTWGDGMVLQHDAPLVHGCVEGADAMPPAVWVDDGALQK